MVRDEYHHYSNEGNCSSASWMAMQDSVIPIVEAGMAQFIDEDGNEVISGIRFYSTPGHTQHHASIELISNGKRAFFAGDIMHTTLQIQQPSWSSRFCESAEIAYKSREWALKHCSDTKATYFSSHFDGTSAGYISRSPNSGSGWAWQYL